MIVLLILITFAICWKNGVAAFSINIFPLLRIEVFSFHKMDLEHHNFSKLKH